MRLLLPLITLILFAGYTGYVMATADQSLFAFGQELMSRPDTAQVVIDLYIMAILASIWMIRDNARRGYSWLAVLPYLLITALFVSIGPLLYLVVRSVTGTTPTPAAHRDASAVR